MTFFPGTAADEDSVDIDVVEDGGAEIIGAVEDYDYGRFGWFLDPEQNKVELWEPR